MAFHLKSLELQGYKTFASRTLFDFSGTVTAIVGPNGSGKSNVADSIRWVLGEQSFNLLRGKKTEDMIFTGSETRPRAGMASATITFDNSDGWLSIDFSEVAVTRRAYRDGQNEYLINGQKVRLRDVSELLAQSGLAERTYSIIGQGLVETALAIKAEERRRLFEEAAGIGLYRSRREEALRRLENTAKNLERVEYILEELKPRLTSLEKQAKKAQDYNQVKADLQVILRDWYGYHWHRAQVELGEAKEIVRLQEGALSAARREQERLNALLGEVRNRIQDLRTLLNERHRAQAEAHNQYETINRRLAVSEERETSLLTQKTGMLDQIHQHDEEIEIQKDRLDSTRQECERISGEISEAKTQQLEARQRLDERIAERALVEKELVKIRQEIGRLYNSLNQARARVAEKRAQLERGAKAIDAAQKSLEQGMEQLKKVELNLGDLKESLQHAQERKTQAEKLFHEHQEKIRQQQKIRQTASEGISNLKTGLARLEAQLKVIQQAERSFSGYTQGTRLLLDAARNARITGSEGAISQHLQVPEEIEVAISAVLGEYIDAVVFTGGVDEALDLLMANATRGILLPVSHLRSERSTWVLEDYTGVVGIASKLVKAPEKLQNSVSHLLGQVLIVQDRKTAKRILAGSQKALDEDPSFGRGWRIVTLKGEVYLVNGPVLSATGVKGQTILGRTRQGKEITQEIEVDNGRLSQLLQEYALVENEERSLISQGEVLASNMRESTKTEDQARLALNQVRQQSEALTRQVAWHHDQLSRLQTDQASIESEIIRINLESSGFEQKISQTQEKQRELDQAYLELALEDLQSNVNYCSTNLAVLKRASDDAQNRLRERETTLGNLLKARTQLQQRYSESLETLEKVVAERSEMREKESEITAKIESLQVLIAPVESELGREEEQQILLEKDEMTARQALSVVEQHASQTRVGLARRQETLDTLKRRIEEDFGLVNFDYEPQVSGQSPLPLDGMVEELPKIAKLSPEVDENIRRLRAQLKRIGPINPEAVAEYDEVNQRYEFLTTQIQDLNKAEADLRKVIHELDGLMQKEFKKTFDGVASEFRQIFTRLFGGGTARLVLTSPEDLTNTGVEIEARLPGRRTQGLSLLSGGERSLTAVALVFALLKVAPTPFCLLDEVDAMLDEANVHRFRELMRELSENTQFIIVTHNRNTVQVADIIYGITLGKDLASQMLSLKVDEVTKLVGGDE